MKKYLFALLMLCAAQVFAQEPLDSAFFHEMEDSVSSLTIVPIEKPEALLKEIAGRLSEDMAQEPGTKSRRPTARPTRGPARRNASSPRSAA